MFAFLSILLVAVLASFGGVLRDTWLAIEILWVFGVGVLIASRIVRHSSIDRSSLVFVLFSVPVIALLQPKLGIGLMAGGWAYLAAKRNSARIKSFFIFLLFLGIFEAALGLVQHFLLPGWIFGYRNVAYTTSGTLINRNHFAGLLEMFIPVVIGLAYSSARGPSGLARSYLYLLSGAFMGLALFFSVSRMGIFAFFSTVFFLSIMMRRQESKHGAAHLIGFAMLTAIVTGALWIGIDDIAQRYSQVATEDAIVHEGRLFVFQDELRMIAAHTNGVGTGNFPDRFREYQTFHPDWFFDHAHNDYLETAAEWGLPVAAAFWSFLIFVVIRTVRLFMSTDSADERGILLACAGAVFSILLHSLTDFNLQIPSNAMLFFAFVGITFALPSHFQTSIVPPKWNKP